MRQEPIQLHVNFYTRCMARSTTHTFANLRFTQLKREYPLVLLIKASHKVPVHISNLNGQFKLGQFIAYSPG